MHWKFSKKKGNSNKLEFGDAVPLWLIPDQQIDQKSLFVNFFATVFFLMIAYAFVADILVSGGVLKISKKRGISNKLVFDDTVPL